MHDKVILENGGMLRFIPDNYKNEKFCDGAVDNSYHALKVVPGSYRAQNMCNKLLIQFNLCLILFLIEITLKKYMIKLSLKTFNVKILPQ